ncbi:hypothetical protein DEO72_LG7g736 [Vigna unguiculata]|uniref:Uncharacterized protein n=1 Tax=Vigna unguiculata TaxID=3917 RepID=A0A4D6MDM7_VIGUN|nr:hypothetical protein DEO72_LG7g736 [Vigna unguiculata]
MAQHSTKLGVDKDIFLELRMQMIEAAQKKGQSSVPNLTNVMVETHPSERDMKRPNHFQENKKRQGQEEDQIFGLGGTLGSCSATSDLGDLDGPNIHMRKIIDHYLIE